MLHADYFLLVNGDIDSVHFLPLILTLIVLKPEYSRETRSIS